MILLLALSAGIVLSPSPYQFSGTLEECSGCHTETREVVKETYPTGFGKWSDAQCFGCHQEINEIAVAYGKGIVDKRFYGLPVRKKKLQQLGKSPLPYHATPKWPISQPGQPARVSTDSLLAYLQRPHGQCDQQDKCQAPQMMAYPELSKMDLNQFELWLLGDTKSSIQQGKHIFESTCKSCHMTSQMSGYNAVAMSLFSADWIHQYVNGKVVRPSASPEQRQMPTFHISKKDAASLRAYFQSRRKTQEMKLDKAVALVQKDWEALSSKPIPKVAKQYIWGRFWRDGGCVHCHEIEGRAQTQFDTSHRGLKRWLQQGNPEELYFRLATRRYEAQFGIGAKKPGMPMTGDPLPAPFVKMIGRWLKSGCVDPNGVLLCANEQEKTQVVMKKRSNQD